MKTEIMNMRAGPITMALCVVVLMFVAILGAPQIVQADTAANATILNVVKVDYEDASGSASFTASASATISVNLVKAALTTSGAPASGSAGTPALPGGQTVSSGSTANYWYALTSNSNGDDVYDLDASLGTPTNLDGSESIAWKLFEHDGTTQIGSDDPSSVTVGGSVIIGRSGTTILYLPAGTLNGIAMDDIVVVQGVDYKVSGVNNGTVASHNTSTHVKDPETNASLTLAANDNTHGSNTTPSFDDSAVGQLVREQVLLQVQVTGVVASAGTDGTVPFDVSSSTQEATPKNSTFTTTTTTFTAPDLSISKLVRNESQSGSFGATASGDPGEFLEYQITISNGGSNATLVAVTDAVPAYTTLVTHNATYGDQTAGNVFAQVSDGTTTVELTMSAADSETPADVAMGAAAGTPANSTLSIYVGTGCTNSQGGSVDNTKTYTILYQVQID